MKHLHPKHDSSHFFDPSNNVATSQYLRKQNAHLTQSQRTIRDIDALITHTYSYDISTRLQ